MSGSLRDVSILVTGGAGFIGSHLVDGLVARGGRVSVIDNLSTGSIDNVNAKSIFYNIDIKSKKVRSVFEHERPKIVFHLASNTDVPRSVRSPADDASQISGALNIVDNCRNFSAKRLIFTSSGFVYGNTSSRPIKEDAPFQPVSPYAISKKSIESYIAFYKNVYSLDYVILRLATIYGPRQVGGAMCDYIEKLSKNKQAEIFGDGSKTRDYVYVVDAVKALIGALDLPADSPHCIFNVGSGIEISLNDIYSKIADLLGKKAAPIYKSDRRGELYCYSLDYSLAKTFLKWKPVTDLEQGLRLTLKYRGLIEK